MVSAKGPILLLYLQASFTVVTTVIAAVPIMSSLLLVVVTVVITDVITVITYGNAFTVNRSGP